MNRLLIAGIAVSCSAAAFAATPPTAANMRLHWDVNPVVFESHNPTPKPVIVLLDFTETGVDPYGVQGWSLGLCVDKTKVKVDSATLGDGAREWTRKDPDNQQPWTRVNVLADGTGVTCGVVIDFNGVVKVPPQTGFRALNVTFSNVGLVRSWPPGDQSSTKVVNCATLGNPPVIPVVVVEGTSISFGTTEDLVLTRVIDGNHVTTELELVPAPAPECAAIAMLTTGGYAVDAVSLGVAHTVVGNTTNVRLSDALGTPPVDIVIDSGGTTIPPADVNIATGEVTLLCGAQVVEVRRGAATQNADLFGAKIVPGGVTLGIVMDLDRVIDKRLPASNHAVEIARFVYGVIDHRGLFVRGDANQDLEVNISDGVYIARALFGLLPDNGCADAWDTNDDEALDPADPIYLLNFLFTGGAALRPPVPVNLRAIIRSDCGMDPAGNALGCTRYAFCQ